MQTRLDTVISNQAYILDSLITLREIYESGCCNDCSEKDCRFKPEVGKLVRYNCMFYKKRLDKEKKNDE